MARTEFDQLIHRYLTGQVTEQERIKIEAWLNVMKTDKSVPQVLTKDEEEILFQKINSSIDNVDEIKTFHPKGVTHSIFFSASFRIAASVVLLLAASLVVWRVWKYNEPIVNSTAQIEKRILTDGTIVWLQKGSSLSYAEDKSLKTRNAVLSGQALFEVTKDPNRPFLISGGGITAKVLGTSFSIKTNSNGVELKVLTGRVNLSSQSDPTGIDVMHDEKIIYSSDDRGIKVLMEKTEADLIVEKTEYKMKFDKVAMNTVLDKIKSKFQIEIDVENPQLNTCRVTADFTDYSLDRTFVALSRLLDIEYKIDGKRIKVSGKGCN